MTVGERLRSEPPPATSRWRTPALWGVLNVTPDSFSDGGRFLDVAAALAHARRMLAEGADVVDVGGASSRPPGRTYGQGAPQVPLEEELRRVLPVVERLVGELGAVVSVDTTRPEVAEASLQAGARIVNDVSCGRDPRLLQVVAAHGAELVLMHNRGRGEREGATVRYGDVVAEAAAEVREAVGRAVALGVAPERIWVDPGIGFAKTAEQSLRLCLEAARFGRLVGSAHRVLLGPSRKSFIAELAPRADGTPPPPLEREAGTAAIVALAAAGGVDAVRVHDVAAHRQAAVLGARSGALLGAGPLRPRQEA